MLRYNGTSVPRDYEAHVQLAIWTFRHQRVFDPALRRLVHLTPLPEGGLATDVAQLPAGTQLDPDSLDFLGPALRDDVAAGIAAGDLNPQTLQPFEDVLPVVRGAPQEGRGHGGPAGAAAGRRSGSAPAQRNGIKAYFGIAPADAPAASRQAAAAFKAPWQGSAGAQTDAQVGRQPRAAQLAALHARGYSSQPQLSGGALTSCRNDCLLWNNGSHKHHVCCPVSIWELMRRATTPASCCASQAAPVAVACGPRSRLRTLRLQTTQTQTGRQATKPQARSASRTARGRPSGRRGAMERPAQAAAGVQLRPRWISARGLGQTLGAKSAGSSSAQLQPQVCHCTSWWPQAFESITRLCAVDMLPFYLLTFATACWSA